MVVVVDYGMGNVGSVVNMLSKVGASVTASADPVVIREATKLVLPGVGAFDNAMTRLHSMGLIEPLNDAVLGRRIPLLGICLGMQLLGTSSEEGSAPGLGWLRATTRKFSFESSAPGLRVPHMGWNLINPVGDSPLLASMPAEPRFYFVHSYHVCCEDPADVMLTTRYGLEFVSGVRKGNIFGVQFHPEKSHKFGMTLIRNYVGLREC